MPAPAARRVTGVRGSRSVAESSARTPAPQVVDGTAQDAGLNVRGVDGKRFAVGPTGEKAVS
ncbi:hypothetical protein [Streptomyces humi]|uniref:hypothetical protein n=1 Tax=Streptomyces humi TaxID=1428620 RepID=UPI0006287B30|nr:hypothetical protein [Streptomyces humi]